jgi:hypothetical protein
MRNSNTALHSCPGNFALAAAITVVVAFAAVQLGAEPPQKIGARIPFVGCKADGQTGPVNAPRGTTVVLPVASELARRLAYYKPEGGLGVLAPRGWYCFQAYGSNGSALYVSPQPIVATDLSASTWNGFAGPIIELLYEYGDTSGRFSVAKVIARVFPTRREFVDKVVKEGFASADSFQSGPFPNDSLTYRAKDVVEFQTPSDTDGLGTYSRLRKNDEPINGVAILVGETPDLALLSVRLPQNRSDLKSAIIHQLERETAHAARQ